jgi:flagellar protein FlbD
MIALHRLGHADEEVVLNAGLIATVEATPDTVVTLTTDRRIVVADSVDEVVEAVRAWHVDIMARSLKHRS